MRGVSILMLYYILTFRTSGPILYIRVPFLFCKPDRVLISPIFQHIREGRKSLRYRHFATQKTKV